MSGAEGKDELWRSGGVPRRRERRLGGHANSPLGNLPTRFVFGAYVLPACYLAPKCSCLALIRGEYWCDKETNKQINR